MEGREAAAAAAESSSKAYLTRKISAQGHEREGTVQEYILYCMSGHKLIRCERFLAVDDVAASRKAIRLQGPSAAELWCGGRKVRTFDSLGTEMSTAEAAPPGPIE